MPRYTEYVRTRITAHTASQLKQISRIDDKPISEILREVLVAYANERLPQRKRK